MTKPKSVSFGALLQSKIIFSGLTSLEHLYKAGAPEKDHQKPL